MALSLLVGIFSGAVAGAFATTASAATSPAACVATPASATTCTTTLHLTSGSWAVHGNAPTTFPAPTTGGFTATENPATGVLSGGTLTLPPDHESNRGSTETIIFSQITSKTATGSISAKGQVTITVKLQVLVSITKPLTFTCLSQPVTVTLRSTTAYDASTGGVTVSDTTFSIPNFANTPTDTCGAALITLNKTFPGSTGNQLSLNLHGTLLVPPTPSVASATTLVASPKVPVATGGNVAGQPTTLTATVGPAGPKGVTGSVQFMRTTVDLTGPVNLSPGKLPFPSGVAVDTATTPNKIYVANYGSNSVSVITAGTGKLTATPHLPNAITVGANPAGVAVDLNSATGTTGTIYVANSGSHSVSVINGATHTVTQTLTLPVGADPSGIAGDTNSTKPLNLVYVADYGLGEVSVINAGATKTVTPTAITVGANPSGVAVYTGAAPNKVYVANYGSNTVSVITGTTKKITGTPLTVGTNPTGVAVNDTTSTHKVYVTNSGANTVTVITGSTKAVTATAIKVGTYPSGVVVDPTVGGATGTIYVANSGSGGKEPNSLSVITGATKAVTATAITVGSGPSGVGLSSATTPHKIYVANTGSNSVSVVNGTTKALTGTAITVGSGTAPTAVLTTTALPAGVNHIKAVYSGNGTYLTSTSTVLSYPVAGALSVNINFPSQVTTTTNGSTGGFTSTSTGEFSGVISDPVSNGPTLPRARLTFALSGVTKLTAAKTTLYVCTTPSYPTTTASKCTKVALTTTISATASMTGHYGGPKTAPTNNCATTSVTVACFPLNPGTQKTLYFKLAFTSKTTTDYGRLVVTTTLATVTSAGTTPSSEPKAALATQTATVNARRSTSPIAKALTVTETVAGTHETRQGYGVTFTVAVVKTTYGPTPTGIVTLYRNLASTAAAKTPIGSVLLPTKTLTLVVTWPVETETYQITATYAGDPFYQAASTTTALALKVTTPSPGVPYVCTESSTGQFRTGMRAYVTSAQGGTLPASAPVGSAVNVTNLSVTANLDHRTRSFGTTSTRGAIDVGTGFTPEGTGSGILPTGAAASTPTAAPYGVAADPKTHTAYVTNPYPGGEGLITMATSTVLVVNETTKTPVGGYISVGKTPRGVAVDPTVGPTGMVYVADYFSKSVSVIDAQTDTVTDTIPVGTKPTGVAVNPKTHTVYVTNNGSASVSVITAVTNAVTATITTGVSADPSGVAVDPTLGTTVGGVLQGTVYLIYSSDTKTLTTIDGATNAVTHTTTVANAYATKHVIAVDPLTHKIYVPSTARLFVLKATATNGPSATRTITGFTRVKYGIAINPTTGPTVGGVRQGTIYVGNYTTSSYTVYVFNGTATTVSTKFTVGKQPEGVAFDPTLGSKGTLDVASWQGRSVSVVDAATKTVTGTAHLSPGWLVTPVVTTMSKPLTMYGTFLASGTAGLSTGTGAVAVGLSSFTWTIPALGTPTAFSCTPATKPYTIGTVDALPLTAPTVTTQPTGQTVDVGTTATFSAAASGELAPTVQWQESTNGTTWTDIAGATGTSYTTGATTGTDNATQYRAVFTNATGSVDTTAATLTVNVPPTVTTQPRDEAVTAGTPVTFSAAASARPASSVQWQVSTDTGATFTNVAGATSTSLTFSPTRADDGNQYRAVFTNTLGKATTTAATLKVTTTAYRLVGADGAIYDFGSAQYEGSMGGQPLNKPIVGMADTPTGNGYWEVASDGGIFSFGDAQFYGSTGTLTLNKPVVGMAATPTGGGYWLVASDGGIFAFGNAQFYGSMGGQPLNKPIVGMAATPTGGGYWLVASDGGIFAFGNAQFYGSTGSLTLNKPIVGMAATPTGGGYWLVASDGGIFSFGKAPFEGSAAGGSAGTVVSMAATTTGQGYWLAGANGSVTAFGDAPLAGSMAGQPLNAPIVGVTG